MVVSDADGTLLWLEGAPQVRLAAANSMNFAVGALWLLGRTFLLLFASVLLAIPLRSLAGLGIVAIGVPIYYFWRNRNLVSGH